MGRTRSGGPAQLPRLAWLRHGSPRLDCAFLPLLCLFTPTSLTQTLGRISTVGPKCDGETLAEVLRLTLEQECGRDAMEKGSL
jgi:hypothetical protein